MIAEVDAALAKALGAQSRQALLNLVGRCALDAEIRSGALMRMAPQVYARPWSLDDPDVWEVAAIRYASPGGLLSHTSALRRFGLLTGPVDVHVCLASRTRGLRGAPASPSAPAIVTHRSRQPLERDLSTGIPSVRPAMALAQSWQMLSSATRRAPIISAVRERTTTVAELHGCMAWAGSHANRRELAALLEMLDRGCESELEIWGFGSVFTTSELAGGVWQYRVAVNGRRYRIDLAYPDARLGVELDGRAYHAEPLQWDRDIARDVALATIGWQTIRFSHHRLTTDPDGCRAELAAVLDQRRRVGAAS